MPSRAVIAATVLRAFSKAGDVIRPATLKRNTPGTYDPETSLPASVSVQLASGLALFARKSQTMSSYLQGLEVKPTDEAVYLQGFSSLPPQNGDTLEVDGVARVLIFVEDVVKANALWLVVAR